MGSWSRSSLSHATAPGCSTPSACGSGRVLKGIDVGRHPAATEWRLYFRLDLDPRSESFVVVLNAEGTRLLRSWRHTEQSAQCGGQATAELSLDEVRAASA